MKFRKERRRITVTRQPLSETDRQKTAWARYYFVFEPTWRRRSAIRIIFVQVQKGTTGGRPPPCIPVLFSSIPSRIFTIGPVNTTTYSTLGPHLYVSYYFIFVKEFHTDPWPARIHCVLWSYWIKKPSDVYSPESYIMFVYGFQSITHFRPVK